MVNITQSILWICEVPKSPYEILAELENERNPISYSSLMTTLGILVAQRKMRKVRRMDKKIVYQTVPQEVTPEPLKTPKTAIPEDINKEIDKEFGSIGK